MQRQPSFFKTIVFTRRQLSHVFLALLFATPINAQTILIDDFNDRNADGWTAIDSTAGRPYGPGTFDADTSAYHLEGAGIIPDSSVPGGGFLASTWDQSSDATFSNGFLRARIRAETQGSLAALVMRISGGLQTGFDGYLFFGSTATFGAPGQEQHGGFILNRIENSQTAQSWSLGPDFTFGVNEDWNIEAGAVDDQLTLKVWPFGAQAPDAPQLVIHDSVFGEGSFGVESNIHRDPFGGPARVSATFDDLYFTFPGPEGDFNNDGVLSNDDLDALMRHMNGDGSIYFDVTDDMFLDDDDFERWVFELRNTWIGDANLDGEFNSGDLVQVFQASEYEDGIAGNSTWSTGDWNADREFDSGDLVTAFQNGGFEQGPRPAAAVPEPAGMFLLWPTLGLFAFSRKRKR